jgi:hypothetical protein
VDGGIPYPVKEEIFRDLRFLNGFYFWFGQAGNKYRANFEIELVRQLRISQSSALLGSLFEDSLGFASSALGRYPHSLSGFVQDCPSFDLCSGSDFNALSQRRLVHLLTLRPKHPAERRADGEYKYGRTKQNTGDRPVSPGPASHSLPPGWRPDTERFVM